MDKYKLVKVGEDDGYVKIGLIQDNDGDYVLYTDHLAALAEKDKLIESLKKGLQQNTKEFIEVIHESEAKRILAEERIKELEAATIEVTETVLKEVGDGRS